jgi:hypothetical protein
MYQFRGERYLRLIHDFSVNSAAYLPFGGCLLALPMR